MNFKSKSFINKRKDNQDSYYSGVIEVDGKENGVLVVCDGMGGLNNGAFVSQTLVKEIRESILTSFDCSDIKETIERVNYQIYEKATKESILMGSTCSVILFRDDNLYQILHVGDSRIYKITDNTPTLLTTDHSALQKYNITKENNPELYKKYKNKLTRCIGIRPNVQIDYYEGTYKSKDKFLCCSDGMWHYLSSIIGTNTKISTIEELVNNAVKRGESDNITVSILTI